MARTTAFGVTPTPSSLGRAGPHGRPTRSMGSVQGSAPGRNIGRWASMCRSIDDLILYDNTSTVVRCQSPGAVATTSRVGRDGRVVRPGDSDVLFASAGCRCRFPGVTGGAPPPARPCLRPTRKGAGSHSLFRAPGLSGEQHHEENPSVRRGLTREAMRSAPSEHPARGNTRNGAHREIGESMSLRTLARDSPRYGRQDMLRVPAGTPR
jgi:hypothetical protein